MEVGEPRLYAYGVLGVAWPVDECTEVELQNSAGKVSLFCSGRPQRKYSPHGKTVGTRTSASIDMTQNTAKIPSGDYTWGQCTSHSEKSPHCPRCDPARPPPGSRHLTASKIPHPEFVILLSTIKYSVGLKSCSKRKA